MLLRYFIFSVAAMMLWPQLLCAQATFTIIPAIDAFATTGPVGNDRSNNNCGGAGALGISAGGSPQGEFQTLMRFNLASTIAFFNTTHGLNVIL